MSRLWGIKDWLQSHNLCQFYAICLHPLFMHHIIQLWWNAVKLWTHQLVIASCSLCPCTYHKNYLRQDELMYRSATATEWPALPKPACRGELLSPELIDLIHKFENAPVPYPTMLLSEQKCAHFCSEWSIMGYGTGALWNLWQWSIPL